MYGCYVEVVFNFFAKARQHPNLVPVLFSVLIYIPTYSFIFKNVFYYSLIKMDPPPPPLKSTPWVKILQSIWTPLVEVIGTEVSKYFKLFRTIRSLVIGDKI